MRSREAKLQKKNGELCGGKVIFCSCFHSPPSPPTGAFAESGPKKKKRERETQNYAFPKQVPLWKEGKRNQNQRFWLSLRAGVTKLKT